MDAIGSWYNVSAPLLTSDFEGGPSGSAWPRSPSGCHLYSADPKVMRSTWPEKWRSRPVPRIAENNLHGMIVVLVPVDQHYGPLSVRSLDRIRRDQQRSRGIGHVARNFEEFVRSIDG